MLKVLRFLALAFVALTVPLQGLAGVMAGQCMALGHHQEAAGHDAHAHAADASHEHADADEGSNAHCGPCTACCASASIAGSESPCIVAPPAVPDYTFSQFPPLGIQPDGLDRPPLAL